MYPLLEGACNQRGAVQIILTRWIYPAEGASAGMALAWTDQKLP
jgi:hypothetical protein